MRTAELQELIGDAHLLARYAARNGKFPADSKVYEICSAIESDTTALNQSGGLIAQLYREIDSLVKAIAPMTLSQLRQRGPWLTWARHAAEGITPFAMGLLTLLLTFYLAFQSSQLNQADTAIREYQEWAGQHPKEKLYTAWKMYRYERVLNVRTPPLAQLDAYQKLVEDARQLVDKGSAIQFLLQDSAAVLYLPRFLESIGPAGLRDFIIKLNQGDLSKDILQSNLPPHPPGYGDTADSSNYQANAGSTNRKNFDCKKDQWPSTNDVSKKLENVNIDIDAYFNSIDCFLRHLNISEVTISYSPWSVIYQTKAKINLLVTWLLPGLYGLLGACVYLMRDLVLPRELRVSHDVRILSMLFLLLRIALGGLAGIIIGWFWVPSPISNNNAVMPISSIPFGIAFMAGFSIETLFSLLDRVNRTVESREPGKGQVR